MEKISEMAKKNLRPSVEYRCPICNRSAVSQTKDGQGPGRYFPFCSERCKLVDLGAWLDADYRIVPSETEEESQD